MRRITFRLDEIHDAPLLEYLDTIPSRALSAQIRTALQRQWLGDSALPDLIRAIQALTTAVAQRSEPGSAQQPTGDTPSDPERQRQIAMDLFRQAGAFDD